MSSMTELMNETDDKEITSNASDFDNAEMLGAKAILDTYNRVFEEAKDNYKYLTELVMVLYYKFWKWFYLVDSTTYKLYHALFVNASDYASYTLEAEEFEYYINKPHIHASAE